MIAKEQIEAALVEVAVKELDEGMSSVLEQAGVDVNDLRQVAIQQCLDVADDLVDAIRRDTGTTVTSGTAMLIVSKLAAEMGLGFSAGLKMGRKDFELPEVVNAQRSMTEVLEEAEVQPVSDDEEEAAAAQLLVAIKRELKGLETARLRLTRPLNDHVSMINAEFRPGKALLEEAEQVLKRRISNYRRRLDEQRRVEVQRQLEAARAREAEEAAAIREAEEAAADDAEVVDAQPVVEDTPTPTSVPVPERLAAPPPAAGPQHRRVQGGGSVTATRVWKFEIEDESQVPRDYLVVDERSIREAVAAGVREIAGVRIFEDVSVAVNTR
jgi:hypothetical protein